MPTRSVAGKRSKQNEQRAWGLRPPRREGGKAVCRAGSSEQGKGSCPSLGKPQPGSGRFGMLGRDSDISFWPQDSHIRASAGSCACPPAGSGGCMGWGRGGGSLEGGIQASLAVWGSSPDQSREDLAIHKHVRGGRAFSCPQLSACRSS